jgi:Tripartite tricarboxylate transporter family receptor
MAGVDMVHVPYRGGGPALSDLIAGQVQVYFATTASSIGYIKGGQLRALAVTSATRAEVLPDVPTVGEFVPGYESSGWLGIGAPRKTPNDIIEKLNKAINASLDDPTHRGRLADLGAAVLPGSPSDFAKLIAEETEKWAKVIKSAGIKANWSDGNLLIFPGACSGESLAPTRSGLGTGSPIKNMRNARICSHDASCRRQTPCSMRSASPERSLRRV